MSAARVPLVFAVVTGLCGVLSVSGQLQPQISKTTEVLTGVLLRSTMPEDRFNHVVAPFSGSSILALAAEGADADTKSQLVTAMGGHPDKNSYKDVLTSIKGFLSDGNARNRVVFKNFVYVYKNFSVLDSFAELARDYYLTDVRSVARPSAEVMRAIFADDAEYGAGDAADNASSTVGTDQHAMLIFNGFSLEMSWPSSTWHRTSTSWNGNVVRAFGAAGNFAIGQIPSIDCTTFILPYKNTDYALLVLMPKNKESSLDKVLEKLQETGLENITKTMSMKPAFVTMPCFQDSNITHMKTLLQERTEVKSLFTDSADLSKLSVDKLYLDDAVQQTGISVCVEGTSSHSLSSSAFTSQRVIKESVVADRPFVYAVYNVANHIIYTAGKLERPVWDEMNDDVDLLDVETIKIP